MSAGAGRASWTATWAYGGGYGGGADDEIPGLTYRQLIPLPLTPGVQLQATRSAVLRRELHNPGAIVAHHFLAFYLAADDERRTVDTVYRVIELQGGDVRVITPSVRRAEAGRIWFQLQRWDPWNPYQPGADPLTSIGYDFDGRLIVG